ncbi:transglycosylase SLT domain-containing protein (plasmid) [Aristophania vespae]|uniref:Transglycosylase SLT domain-containing protein n=1 Tax=Aristophania vespae TaxID=2697033 RepID=A0A6P1NNQ0_9PROT|nr:transglycosylase SLT domain-containing protein [Aristophania vespae]QHI96481.1 transglycosylase SLT domain-containing protein [Aristophania vespae]
MHGLKTLHIFACHKAGLTILLIGLLYQNSWGKSAESDRCILATTQVERALHLPDGFLSAMSRVETGRPDTDGTLSPWPWTINAAGVGYHYHSLREAIEAVEDFQKKGVRSIDVGCMQVNIMHHPDAFSSLEMAFDPYQNALYAGQFLKQMFEKKGSWPRAAAAYHSQTPGIGEPYLWRVIEEWAIPQDGRQIKTPNIASHHPLFARNPSQNMKRDITKGIRVASKAPHVPLKQFRPFRGFQHFSEPPPTHNRINNAPKGRSLASYRAAPVRIATTLPQAASY